MEKRTETEEIRLLEDANVSRFLPRIDRREADPEFLEAAAENDGAILAVCLGGETVGLTAAWDDGDRGFVYVYIFPEFRKRGYGLKAAGLAAQRLCTPEMREIVTSYPGTDRAAKGFAAACGYSERYASARMEYRGEKFELPALPVRQYEDADYPEAFTLAQEAFHRMRLETGRFPDSVQTEPGEESRRAWAETARERWVFESDGEIVGCAHLEGAELDSVSVRVSRQGEGFGRAFVKYLVNLILDREEEAPYLWCVIGNDKARRLYDSLGFEETDRVVFARKTVRERGASS